MNFKMQVVYEAGPNSRFNKIASRLQIGKIVFISGFFDLNENELPFIEAKEIDLLDDFNNNSSQDLQILIFDHRFHMLINLKVIRILFRHPPQINSKLRKSILITIMMINYKTLPLRAKKTHWLHHPLLL